MFAGLCRSEAGKDEHARRGRPSSGFNLTVALRAPAFHRLGRALGLLLSCNLNRFFGRAIKGPFSGFARAG